jgi:hypothetical protein
MLSDNVGGEQGWSGIMIQSKRPMKVLSSRAVVVAGLLLDYGNKLVANERIVVKKSR